MDDWIRLMNAETEEEVDMIRTENPGVLAAIREIKIMNLGKGLRALYEAHMKEVRDRNARDEYVWEEGIAKGKAEGKAEGESTGQRKKLINIVRKMSFRNMSPKAISDMLEEDGALVAEICSLLRLHPDWGDDKIEKELKDKS